MAAGLQCDNCRKFGPSEGQWIYVGQQSSQHRDPILAALGIGRTEPLTFCSSRCEAEHAYARAVIEGPAEASEPVRAEQSPAVAEVPPSAPLVESSGVGWPG